MASLAIVSHQDSMGAMQKQLPLIYCRVHWILCSLSYMGKNTNNGKFDNIVKNNNIEKIVIIGNRI